MSANAFHAFKATFKVLATHVLETDTTKVHVGSHVRRLSLPC